MNYAIQLEDKVSRRRVGDDTTGRLRGVEAEHAQKEIKAPWAFTNHCRVSHGRMVFGQPRQDDLVEFLLQQLPRETLASRLDQPGIDLAAREVLDVFTCIREHTHLDAAGKLLTQNAERHLKSDRSEERRVGKEC